MKKYFLLLRKISFVPALALLSPLNTLQPLEALAADTPLDNVFRTDISADIPSFNYLIETDLIQSNVLSLVYEGLLDRDPETYDFTPLLAKSYSISKDGMSFTYELDEKAAWFDGKPVTSADVQFTLDTMFDPKVDATTQRSVYASINPKIDIINERKFVIHARTKHFNNLALSSGFNILPKHLLAGTDMNKGPILKSTFGSGPYMLDEWKKGSSVSLKKNPNYWGSHVKVNKGAHNFDKLLFRVVREPKIGLELLKEAFFSYFVFTSEQWEKDSKNEKIQAKYDTYSFINKAPKGFSFIGWNNAAEPFTSAKIRLALSQLLNRPFMIEKFTYKRALPAIGPIVSTSVYAPKDLKPIDYDPQNAVRTLNAEGWKDTNGDGILDKNGKKLEFTLMFSNPDTEKYLTVYKEDLAKVGVTCNLKRVDWTTFSKLIDTKKFEAVILGWSASVDPDLYQIWHSDSIKDNGSNFVSYKNEKVDKLILDAQKEFNKDKRIKLNQEISRLIAADAPYTFFLENPTNFVAARKGITRPKDFLNYSVGTAYWRKSSDNIK